VADIDSVSVLNPSSIRQREDAMFKHTQLGRYLAGGLVIAAAAVPGVAQARFDNNPVHVPSPTTHVCASHHVHASLCDQHRRHRAAR